MQYSTKYVENCTNKWDNINQEIFKYFFQEIIMIKTPVNFASLYYYF